MKQCSKCKEYKILSMFNTSKKAKDKLFSYCRECQKSHNNAAYKVSSSVRERIKLRNKLVTTYNLRLINKYKSLCKCQICGETDYVCLDLHHLDPSEKEDDPSSLVRGSLEKLKNEIRKCAVLCANCHRKLHKILKDFNACLVY